MKLLVSRYSSLRLLAFSCMNSNGFVEFTRGSFTSSLSIHSNTWSLDVYVGTGYQGTMWHTEEPKK